MLIFYCKSVHYLFAINDGLCQVRDPGKDASFDEHNDQEFHLARKNCIIPGCCRQMELYRTDTGYLPQEYHTPEEIGLSDRPKKGLKEIATKTLAVIEQSK